MSRARFAALWGDNSITIRAIARQLDISPQAVRFRALSRGLPARRGHPRADQQAIRDPAFADMWLAGVCTRDLVALYGTHHMTVPRTARRLGLPPRGRGWQPRMTLAEWRAARVASLMAASAAETRAAITMADMADRIGPRLAA